MKRRSFPWRQIAFMVLFLAGIAFATLAMRPLLFRTEKALEIRRENRQFYAQAEIVQEMVKETVEIETPMPEEPSFEEPVPEEPLPYGELYQAIRQYNEQLIEEHQSDLTNRAATEAAPLSLTQYGLESEVFGVIRIPAMELEMPIYLGASGENMANGAAVLTQTSIPIGGENTNAVIAGHRGWNGYPYFLNIETLEIGDMMTVTNLWGELHYRVERIRIVYPNDIEAILIQEGKDMLTLMTCHPPNSGGKYRYLVYCERVND